MPLQSGDVHVSEWGAYITPANMNMARASFFLQCYFKVHTHVFGKLKIYINVHRTYLRVRTNIQQFYII